MTAATWQTMRHVVVVLGLAALWLPAEYRGALAAGSVDQAAEADMPAITMRTGNHPGFSRIVFDLPSGASFQTVVEGSRILIVFEGGGHLAQPVLVPRNLTSLQAGGQTATLSMAPGARFRPLRVRNRLIADILDPVDRTNSATPAVKPTIAVPSSPQGGGTGAAGPLTHDGPGPPVPSPASAADARETGERRGPTPSPAVASATIAVVEASLQPQETPAPIVPADAPAAERTPQPAFVLPADSTVGAAAFRREGLAIVVLDRKLPLTSPSTVPASLIVPGADSTLLQLPLAPGAGLMLERVSKGWSVAIVDPAPPPAPSIQMTPKPDGVTFYLPRAGRAVTILDPTTGSALLVGTSLSSGTGSAVGQERRTPGYTVVPTWLGVTVEPRSDEADLHMGPSGFELRGGGLPPATVAGPTTLRRLDLPNEPEPALLNRLRAQLVSAAMAAPRGRTAARLAAVQAMLALGLGVEAQALVQKAIADDPQAAADVQPPVLAAIAAVLAGRLAEADALDNPQLDDDPEIALWRGVRDRRLARDTEAARRLPAQMPLVLSYPEPLRRLVWPDLVEAAAESGVPIRRELLTPFASALVLEHDGKLDEALAVWQAVAKGPDRLDQVRAAVHATELRLATGRVTTNDAADEFERQSFAWRGDGRELSLRLRAAELRSGAGKWRIALDMLRDTERAFPEEREGIRVRKSATFEAMLAADGAQMAPLDVVLLATDYADCVPDDAAGARLATLLADKLLALDLPARAIPVLQGLVAATRPGPARAEFGARLGQLLLEGGDAAGAVVALHASDTAGLDAGLKEARGLLMARAQAADGNVSEAMAELVALQSPEADDLRATLLAKRGDWQGTADALGTMAAKLVPSEGALSDAAQAVVMRQASAAVQAADAATLRRLALQIPRMTGAEADLLRVLTNAPVTSISELARSASELRLARVLHQRLQLVGER